jgi:hypothetical protein
MNTIQKSNEFYTDIFVDTTNKYDDYKIESIDKIIKKIADEYKLTLHKKYINNTNNNSLVEAVNELLLYDWKYIQNLNLYQIFGKNKQMTDQIWKTMCGCVNGMVSINSDMSLLIKENFNIQHETNEIKMLFDYISSNDELCIAGGYPTLFYLNKNSNDYINSDIDIFIMGGYDYFTDEESTNKLTNKFINLIDYINSNFKINSIASFSRNNDNKYSVFDIKCEKINRTIQIICTCSNNFAEVLHSFDSSYSKCGFYKGEFYMSHDMKYSIDLGITWFYKNPKKVFARRTAKAKKLGFVVLNESSLPDFEKNFVYFAVEEVKKVKLDKIETNKQTQY